MKIIEILCRFSDLTFPLAKPVITLKQIRCAFSKCFHGKKCLSLSAVEEDEALLSSKGGGYLSEK